MSDCEKCGQEHLDWRGRPGCTGHVLDRDADGRKILGTDKPCRKIKRDGATVCATHGGSTKNAIATAKRNVTERKAAAIMQTYGRPVETTATDALLDEVKWTAGYVAWLREQVGQLDEAELVWGKTKSVEGDVVVGDGASASLETATATTEEAKPHIFRQMLLEERAHLVKVCTAAISAGIEERKVRLAEQQGALVADAIKQILDDLGLTPEQAARVPEVVPRRLRLLIGGAA